MRLNLQPRNYSGLPIALPQRQSIRLLCIPLLCLIAMAAAVYCHAQSTSGEILGTLTEQTGAVIVNTQVTLTNIETAQVLQTKTNDSGFYRFVNVPPGSYRLTVTKQGFRPISREPINLQVEGSVQINLSMVVGEQSENVVVNGETPLVQAETDSLGAVIDERETNELPLNGRNPMNLAALVPSVVPQGGSMGTPTGQNAFAAGNYQVGGGMANESATFLDGAPLNSAYYYMTVPVPTQDSLEEFKVDTNNLSAEYGRLAGGAINFRTKSGTNKLRGSLWEFLRNKVLNANTFFGNQAGLPRPPFTQNQYGFNIGGPFYIPKLYNGKNKTFFFVNWEGFGLRQGVTDTETMPTAAERGGDLSELQTPIYDPNTTCGASPGVTCAPGESQYDRKLFNDEAIPKDRLNSTALAYLNQFFPMPNVPGGPLGVNNFTRTYSFGGNNYETVVHVDQNVSEKQHISARYTYWQNHNLPLDPLGTGICIYNCAEEYNVNDFVADDTYAFNSTTVLDLRGSFLRLNYNRNALLDNYSLTSLGMPASLAAQVQFPSPPVMSVSGFDTNGTFGSQGADSVIHDIADDLRFAGSLTKILGNHTLKIGGEFERGTLYYVQSNPAGTYYFNNGFTAQNPETGAGGTGLASFLLGYAASGYSSMAAPTNGEMLYPAVFANDDWRATSRLTMHLGVRWENNMPWTERNNLMSYFDPKAVNPLLQQAGITQYPGSVELVASSTRQSRTNQNDYLHEFSPRVGLSYGIAHNTVVSMGYGIFWLPEPILQFLGPSVDPINAFSTPYVASTNNGLTPANNLSNPFPGGFLTSPGRSPSYQGVLLGTGLSEFNPDYPYPYAQQWNVGVQQQLGRSFVVAVAYGGAKGTDLPFYSLQANQLPDGDLALGNALNASASNPFYGVINPNFSIGSSTIPAGQLLLKYPQYAGVSFYNPTIADSTYHSLQVTAQKRFSGGASINAAYTMAKFLSDTDTETGWLEPAEASSIQDNNNLKAEKSLSSNDVRNRLVISYIYDIPLGRGKTFLSNAPRMVNAIVGGWGLGGTTTLQSGFPLGFTTNQNLTNSFGGGSRPNYTPACQKSVSGSAVSRLNNWFNTACFTQPPAFTFGNEPRNDAQLRAPGIADWDSSAFKNFPFESGKGSFQFRAEAFNLFNRVQFGYPGLTQGTSNFGIVSSQYNLPRVLQFSLRLNY